MDDLIDELSGTTIDEEQKAPIQKCKITKMANRCASIINRSKLLILNDSDSSEEDIVDKKSINKYSRFSKYKNSWKAREHSKILTKRKRNSGSEVSAEINTNKNFRKKHDPMEIDCESSDLSDDCPPECNFDGDDEQSDFYDSTVKNRPKNRYYLHSKPKTEFKMPKPVNPFSVEFETHSPNQYWKRRKSNGLN